MAYGIVFKKAGEKPAEIIQIVNYSINADRFDSTGELDFENATDEADLKTKASVIEANWAQNFEVKYIKKNA